MTTANAPVLCLGEALIDIVDRGGERSEHVGGSPLNVACGLAALDHATGFAGWWGDDERGRAISAHASAAGLRVVEGSDGAFRTSTALAMLDASNQASYEFDLDWQLPSLDLDQVGHLHTGSIAATLAPGADAVLAAVQAMRGRGTVSYDPNARPAIMGSAAQVRGRIEELIAAADVVKASDEDIAWLYGRAIPLTDVARTWLASGPGLVVVTRGGQGAVAFLASQPEPLGIDPLRVEVTDTVGAGDSFMAGLLSGLLDAGLLGSREARSRLQDADWDAVRPALERAAATSGITVTHAGAYSPSRAEVAAAR